MRRPVALLAVAAALVALVLPAQAGSGTTRTLRVADPQLDWQVPWQDVVGGGAVIGLDKAGRATGLTVSLDHLLPLLPGTSGTYDLYFGADDGVTCHLLAARVRWAGPQVVRAYGAEQTYPCTGGSVALDEAAGLLLEAATADLNAPSVDASVSGSTVTVRYPAPTWLRRGLKAGVGGTTHPGQAGATGVNGKLVCDCDFAGMGRNVTV